MSRSFYFSRREFLKASGAAAATLAAGPLLGACGGGGAASGPLKIGILLPYSDIYAVLGESITAREAERLNVVNRVVPAAEFPAALEATVTRMLALPLSTVRASKQLTRLAFDLDREPFRDRMNAVFAPLLDSPEYRAAMEAYRRAHTGAERPSR